MLSKNNMKISHLLKRTFAASMLALAFVTFVATKADAAITREQTITEPTGGSPSTTQGLLYLPDDYATSGQSYPLIVQLPGTGEQGSDINALLHSGTMSWRIENGFSPSAVNPIDGKTYKFIVYTPQGPANTWGWQAVPHLKTIIPDLESKYRIDPSRVYITGYSGGGWGAWTTTDDVAFLQTIAALAPVSSAAAKNVSTIPNAATYNLPVWSIVGDQDSFVINSQSYTNTINALNPKIPAKLTILPGVGHSAWNQAYDPNWKVDSLNLYQWFLQYTRGTSDSGGTNAAPTATISVTGGTVAPATITLAATASDSDGTISKVDFYNGTTLLGTDTSAPYSYTASGLAAGTYLFKAVATDNKGATGTSNTVTVTVTGATQALAPYGGTPAAIPGTIQAENYDLGGQNVAYYDSTSGNTGGAYRSDSVDVETVLGGSVTDVGWTTDNEWLKYTVQVAKTGAYTVTANIATPNAGKTIAIQMDGATVGTIVTVNTGWWQTYTTGTLTGVPLTAGTHVMTLRFTTGSNSDANQGINLDYLKFDLEQAGNATPTVSLNAPLDAAVYTAPTTITLAATASDSDGTISKVDFYNGTTLLGTDTSAPYEYAWNSVGVGTYTLSARATDDDGAIAASNGASVTVKQPTELKPTVAITAPNSGATFTAPATITVTATADEVGGTITRVDFYNGTHLVSSDKVAPYAITRKNVIPGTFSVTAVAFDANGNSTTSDPITFSVTETANVPPTVSAGADQTITLPTNTVTLMGTASDSDGTISKYAWSKISGGSATIATANAASTTVTGLAQGSYVFRLTATDNDGSSASDDVAVTVNSQSACAGTVYTLTPPNGNGGMSITGAAYKPGDTIVLNAKDAWTYLYTDGLTGSANCPITITNTGGTVHMQNGIALHNANYVHIDGSGVSGTQYGIEVAMPYPADIYEKDDKGNYIWFINNDLNNPNFSWRGTGEAISIQARSAHIEVNNTYLHDRTYGVIAKQDISCDANYNYPNWTIDDIRIHDNKIEHMNQEGMYLGSTDPAGTTRSTAPGHCENYTFTAPLTLKLSAGNLGSTANYYKNGVLIGSGASYSWTNVPTGTYTITATNGSNSAKPFTMTVVSGTNPTQTNQIIFGTDKDNIIVVPEQLGNVQVYNNTVNSTQRSGIQLSGAAVGKSVIYNNHVTGSGYEINKDQGAGIWVGGESNAEVYNNYIRNTFKDNIISYGIGVISIHDNDISGAGVLPQDKNQAGNCGTVVINCTYPYAANSIHLSTRTTNPTTTPWPSFTVKNNTVGIAQAQNVGVDKGFEQFASAGNVICNSGTVSVESVVNWSNDCSGGTSLTQTTTTSQGQSAAPDNLTTFIPATTATTTTASTATVTANTLNVRATPGGTVIAKVHRGESVTVRSSSGVWANVTLANGTNGWVSTRYIQTSVSPTTSGMVTVTAGMLNVRATPGGTVIGKVSRGTTGTVISVDAAPWNYVQFSNGLSGYVSQSYLGL
jgi:poly(3-hydroxybutyrate) depolymerase